MSESSINPGVSGQLDHLQAEGVYTVTRTDLRELAGVSETALVSAVGRLKKQGRVAEPRRGFLVAVPLEYRSAGVLPPSWWIDDLMAFLQQPYYVGLLAAAALHGAGHQRPQSFQVITDRATRPVRAGRVRIVFARKDAIAQAAVQRAKTETGSMALSIPEETAFDLVRYARICGGLSNVATILAGLGDGLDPGMLVQRAEHFEVTVAQKLGYLLDLAGHDRVTGPLHTWVVEQNPVRAPLSWNEHPFTGTVDQRWRVVVNRSVEIER
jgi:predicted transcriptional regulator of viral defense system